MRKILLSLLGILLLISSCKENSKTSQDNPTSASQITLYFGGDILTMEGEEAHYAEAVVQQDGKIAFIGSLDDAEKQFPNAGKKDLQGKTLLPGFIDGHGHLYLTGFYNMMANLLPPPDGGCNSIQGVVDEMNAWKDSEKGQFFLNKFGWLVGFGYDDSQLAEKEHPTADDLDKVSTEVPVIIIHQSGHLGAVNHKALEIFSITKASKDPVGGHIRKDANGHPTGVLEETAFQPLQLQMLPKIDDETDAKIVENGQKMYAQFGYTTAQEGGGNTGFNNSLQKAADHGELYIDLVTYTVMDMGLDAMTSKYYTNDHSYKNHYRVGGVKLVLDGSPQGKTAWLTKPYLIPPSGKDHNYHGYPKFSKEDAQKFINQAFENKWQLLAHTNGDAAVDEYLLYIKDALKNHGYDDHRSVIIHGQVIRKDQIQQIADLNVLASEYAVHTFYWGDWHLNSVLGSPRAEYISPCRDLIDAGINLTSHSDCPVIPPNSLRIIDATTNRVTRSGLILGPEQRITPYEALLTQTRWGAYQYFEEDHKGTLSAGKLADFVVLDQNPLKIDPMKIHTIKVVETIKEGKPVYENNAFK
ncbi:amidohydrolase [Flavihumibacter fluvii]|uniref:amidohydrolase n=1 Tax=Flavihumibacter fluvii TaxID=2838157 RepID=UPI001BDE33D7|nr:amidohydrolase [Flavihumibacter fluvii]ULQ51163.1 amidohydrolase [Flavihumibacter fluvii]